MAEPALSVAHLTCHRGRRTVLDDVSLSVDRGCCLAVLGAADSGKTALMRVLAGHARAGGGAVLHEATPIGDVPGHRRGFGVVQQPDALFPDWTLARNVALPLRLRRVRRRDRRRLVDAALDLAELSQAGGLLPEQACEAQRRRALLARAIVFGPKVLLLDDPFAFQNEAERLVMAASIRRARLTLGAAVVLATRHSPEAVGLADMVAALDQGRVAQTATPEIFRDRPVSAVVAGLLGEMNFLSGTAGTDDDDLASVQLDCGPHVLGRAAAGLRAGGRCVLAISPARIAIAPVRAADMGDGALDATVIETQFFGETTRLHLLLGAGASLIVLRQAAAGTSGLDPGSCVAVAWQPYHATVFPATS